MALDTAQPAQSLKTPKNAHVSGRGSKPGHKAAIRNKCLECQENKADVRNCPFNPKNCISDGCPLWPFRLGRAPRGSGSRTKAIRAYCLWCANGQTAMVRECDTTACPLHSFRMGRRLK